MIIILRLLALLFVVAVILFVIGAILFTLFGFFKFFYHDILNWHSPNDELFFDGNSFCSKCKYCNHKIMQDSQGNWFRY